MATANKSWTRQLLCMVQVYDSCMMLYKTLKDAMTMKVCQLQWLFIYTRLVPKFSIRISLTLSSDHRIYVEYRLG